jgi:hypothetical protein
MTNRPLAERVAEFLGATEEFLAHDQINDLVSDLHTRVQELQGALFPEGECECRDAHCGHPARYHAVVRTKLSTEQVVEPGLCIVKECKCGGWM